MEIFVKHDRFEVTIFECVESHSWNQLLSSGRLMESVTNHWRPRNGELVVER
jgi:hypothetical protein